MVVIKQGGGEYLSERAKIIHTPELRYSNVLAFSLKKGEVILALYLQKGSNYF